MGRAGLGGGHSGGHFYSSHLSSCSEKKNVDIIQLPQLEGDAGVVANNAEKIIMMHDKLASDIEILKTCKTMTKTKSETVKDTNHVSMIMTGTQNAASEMKTFDRMEEKVDREMAEAQELQDMSRHTENTDMLAAKYGAATPDATAELDALVAQFSGATTE